MRSEAIEAKWTHPEFWASFDLDTDEYLAVCRRLGATRTAVDNLLWMLVRRKVQIQAMRWPVKPSYRVSSRWIGCEDRFCQLSEVDWRELSGRYFLVQEAFRKYQAGVGENQADVIALIEYRQYVADRIKGARRKNVLHQLAPKQKSTVDAPLPYTWRALIQVNKLVGRAYSNAKRESRLRRRAQAAARPPQLLAS